MVAFLQSLEGYSAKEAAARTGISHESIRLYRANRWKRLDAKTCRAMRVWLDMVPARESRTWTEGYGAAVQDLDTAMEKMRTKLARAEAEANLVEKTRVEAEGARNQRRRDKKKA